MYIIILSDLINSRVIIESTLLIGKRPLNVYRYLSIDVGFLTYIIHKSIIIDKNNRTYKRTLYHSSRVNYTLFEDRLISNFELSRP